MHSTLDVHSSEDAVTPDGVAQAHVVDGRTHRAHGAHHLRDWLDGPISRISRLVGAPPADVAAAVHREAHGSIAQESTGASKGART